MHEVRIPIRWRDMDAYGHVNNAVYLNFLEECRDAWVQAVLSRVADPWDFVLVHVGIDYRRELTQADGEVVVRCRLDSFGRASIHTREEIAKGDGTIAAEAESVIVPRDANAMKARSLTEAERSLLRREMDGREPAGPAS
jgi:acyl-CoA thioester hydrolase